jgi:hypothetical protein
MLRRTRPCRSRTEVGPFTAKKFERFVAAQASHPLDSDSVRGKSSSSQPFSFETRSLGRSTPSLI